MLSCYKVLPCVPADIPNMVEVYIAAFADNPMNQIWAPPSKVTHASMSDWLTRRIKVNFTQPEMKLYKAVDATGGMIAWTRWSIPHEPEAPGSGTSDTQSKWPAGAVSEACEAFFGALGEMKKKWVDVQEFYVCHLLVTLPTHQRRGLGRLLLSHVLDMADSEGRRTYIEASEAGHVLYLKLGWTDVDRISIDFRKWGGMEEGINWVMIREPRRTSQV